MIFDFFFFFGGCIYRDSTLVMSSVVLAIEIGMRK